MSARVACYDCGRAYGYPRKRCDCGEPVWFDLDPPASWPEGGDRSLWRYDGWLPVGPPDGVGATAGGTPTVRAGRLDDYAGCLVRVKDETRNATGSFKDRGSAVGVAWAAANGVGRVGTVSHGNMAMSVAANAAAAGLGCVVLIPADIPAARLGHIAAYDPTIVRVDGDYGRLYYDALDLEDDLDVAFVNSDTPLRVAGQKTTALEVCEGRVPDAVVLPASSGGHASAVWKALRELDAAGLIDAVPRIYLVQAAACDPIAAAYREGRGVAPVERGETIAYSIANPDPPSGDRALAAVRDTGGAAVSVDDGALREARGHFSARAGLDVEPASAAALAGARELSRRGEIEREEDVVVVATGTGLTEERDERVEAPTVPLDGLADGLADLT